MLAITLVPKMCWILFKLKIKKLCLNINTIVLSNHIRHIHPFSNNLIIISMKRSGSSGSAIDKLVEQEVADELKKMSSPFSSPVSSPRKEDAASSTRATTEPTKNDVNRYVLFRSINRIL